MLNTAEQPIDVVADELDVRSDELEPDDDLTNDLGADSIDRLALAIALERRCGVPVADAAIQEARTVEDVTDLVAANRR